MIADLLVLGIENQHFFVPIPTNLRLLRLAITVNPKFTMGNPAILCLRANIRLYPGQIRATA